MKEGKKRLFMELLKNSKRSDRELAKVLGVSQPTITRMRHKLVEEGTIREFTVIPDFIKLGYKIMAITIAKAKIALTPEEQEKTKTLVLENPNVIFVASANGMGRNGVMISLHRNYSDFVRFMSDLKSESTGYMENVDNMLISLTSGDVVKPLSLSYLAGQEDPQAETG